MTKEAQRAQATQFGVSLAKLALLEANSGTHECTMAIFDRYRNSVEAAGLPDDLTKTAHIAFDNFIFSRSDGPVDAGFKRATIAVIINAGRRLRSFMTERGAAEALIHAALNPQQALKRDMPVRDDDLHQIRSDLYQETIHRAHEIISMDR